MAHQTQLIIALDPGTSGLAATYALGRDTFDNHGRKSRSIIPNTETQVDNWPGASRGVSPGHVCLPTTLIYHRVSKTLLHWGFAAQKHLAKQDPAIDRKQELVVENVKLLLPHLQEVTQLDKVSELPRHKKARIELFEVLGKEPSEVFGDLLRICFSHILKTAVTQFAPRGCFSNPTHIELVICFPGGWHSTLHTDIAKLSADALQGAITKNNVLVDSFGLQDIYTVSETLCGIRCWMQTNLVDEAESTDPDRHETVKNISCLKNGNIILGIDMGAGTTCITTLCLVDSHPLRVDQLGATLSLPISGDAVDALCEKYLEENITREDFVEDFIGDVNWIRQNLLRSFRDEKKVLGESPINDTEFWGQVVVGLKENPAKGFRADYFRVPTVIFEHFFDPVVTQVELAIENKLALYPNLKAAVFQGQFGSSSQYLKNKLRSGRLQGKLDLFHSRHGKWDVINGAMMERSKLDNKFIRNYTAMQNYGTLLAVAEKEAQAYFPNTDLAKVGFFEDQDTGRHIIVVNWVIVSGTTITDSVYGNEDQREVSWAKKDEIEILDAMIVSDIIVPPEKKKRRWTLWTPDLDQNTFYDNDGRKVNVQQSHFRWKLAMSEKLDRHGNKRGPFSINDMLRKHFQDPEALDKTSLHYYLPFHLLWEITETQLKISYKPQFKKSAGKPTTQLGKQLPANSDLLHILSHESRSADLYRDIKFTEESRARSHALRGVSQPASTDCLFPLVSSAPTGQAKDLSSSIASFQPINRGLSHIGVDLVAYASGPRSIDTRSHTAPVHTTSPQTTPPSITLGEKGCVTCTKTLLIHCDAIYSTTGRAGQKSCQNCIDNEVDCRNAATLSSLEPTMHTVNQSYRKRKFLPSRSKRPGESSPDLTSPRRGNIPRRAKKKIDYKAMVANEAKARLFLPGA